MSPVAEPATPKRELPVAQRDQVLNLIGRHSPRKALATEEDQRLSEDLGLSELDRLNLELAIESQIGVDVRGQSFLWVTVGEVLSAVANADRLPDEDDDE